jgi:Pentapeptide repeats (8 copies)
MSGAYYHQGLTIEFDVSVPRLTIEGRELPTEQLAGIFALSESPSVKAEKLRQYGKEIIERSPGFQKRESTRQTHLAILKRGVPEWNKWRTENPEIRPLLYDCDLSRATLLVGLNGVDFANAVLINSNLAWQELKGANFHEANLGGAKLHHADLTGANFCTTDLYETELLDAVLNNANLQGTQLAKTNFEGAQLVGCKIYGISAWDLKLDRAVQRDLIIRYQYRSEGGQTELSNEDQIVVDNLEVAQFIYLLLHNRRIRHVIDTITSKVILILGRFTEERKAVLDAIREELRNLNLTPVMFDFDKPVSKDVTGTVETLARLARFIIADLTDPSSIPHELATVVPFLRTTPVLPIKLKGSGGYSMFDDFRRSYPWVLEPYQYKDNESLISALPEVIAPADRMAEDFRNRS